MVGTFVRVGLPVSLTLMISWSAAGCRSHASDGRSTTDAAPSPSDAARDAYTPPTAARDARDANSVDAMASDSAHGDVTPVIPLTPSPDCKHGAVAAQCEKGMCKIPPGCFVMGVPRGAATAAAFDNAEIEVTLTHAFLIGETEVTREQWLALGLPEPTVDWRTLGPMNDPKTPPPGQKFCETPDCPVAWLSYEDAMAFCNVRSEAEGLAPCYELSDCTRKVGDNMRCQSVRVIAKSAFECEGYRLPTEAEWEYATRAGTRTDLYSGDLDPKLESDSGCMLDRNLDAVGWYCGNSDVPPYAPGSGRPQPVAQKQPNAFGLFDTSGNLFEWTNDRYNPNGYGTGPLTDPIFGLDDPRDLTPKTPIFNGMTDGKGIDGFPGFRIRRGGAFDLWAQLTGSGRRDSNFSAGHHTGFRIARTLPAKASAAEAKP